LFFPRLASCGDFRVFVQQILITPSPDSNAIYRSIFPLLKSVGIDLEIALVILLQRSWARLHDESYLGYDRIQGGKAEFRRIRIFQGYLFE